MFSIDAHFVWQQHSENLVVIHINYVEGGSGKNLLLVKVEFIRFLNLLSFRILLVNVGI